MTGKGAPAGAGGAASYANSPISYDPGRAPGRISVRILGFTEGLVAIDGARLVRVVSEDHTLLIMEDFAPVLGECRGTVTVLTDEGERRFEVKRGYYLHTHNEFSLVICEEFRDLAGAAERARDGQWVARGRATGRAEDTLGEDSATEADDAELTAQAEPDAAEGGRP